MSGHHEFWSRGRRGVVHSFECHTSYLGDGEPRLDMRSLCGRHEFTLDRPLMKYEPWMGENFPPENIMCKACLKEATRG